MQSDTIYALSSGRGKAGIAVFRLSGPDCDRVVRALTKRHTPEPRVATLTWFVDPDTKERIDQGLLLWFPDPNSFTGENCAECHVHGGLAVQAAMQKALAKIPGTRPAEPGEFARRAFHHGRLDLTAVEGLGDLIEAETEGQRRQAVRQMDGEMARIYDGWRNQLIESLALVEASIDFADEDLPDDVAAWARPVATELLADITAHLTAARVGERIRDGLTIAILGAPNVGKSSLLNALARRDAAIVSDRAGTTRDVIEVHLDLAGLPVILLDTAGLHDTDDVIEQEGIRRARSRAASADLKLLVIDAADGPTIPDALADMVGPDSLVVINKVDNHDQAKIFAETGDWSDAHRPIAISVKTGQGLDRLLDELTVRAEALLTSEEPPLITRARHRHALEDCAAHLDRFLTSKVELELLAEDLRLAARALGRITGRIDVEDLLDVIFSSFCIGK